MTPGERALLHRILLLEKRLGAFIGGGATVTPHATQHENGGSDPIDVTDLDGFPGGSTTFLRGDATFAGAGFPSLITVLTSGTGATFSKQAATTRLLVWVVGGGGGAGGGDQDATGSGCGSGGGAGAIAIKLYTSPASSYLYTIGPGGAGGAAGNNAGTAGTASTFDNAGSPVTASGGPGGGSMAAGTGTQYAGAQTGATATGGDLNIAGAVAQRAFRGGSAGSPMATNGAPGLWGATPGQPSLNANGQDASGYGAGGGGAAVTLGGTDRAGGAGFAGVIIVWEYS